MEFQNVVTALGSRMKRLIVKKKGSRHKKERPEGTTWLPSRRSITVRNSFRSPSPVSWTPTTNPISTPTSTSTSAHWTHSLPNFTSNTCQHQPQHQHYLLHCHTSIRQHNSPMPSPNNLYKDLIWLWQNSATPISCASSSQTTFRNYLSLTNSMGFTINQRQF